MFFQQHTSSEAASYNEDQIITSDYCLVDKDDILEDIHRQVKEAQKALGIYDNRETIIAFNKDDMDFINQLGDALISYTEKSGRRTLIPYLQYPSGEKSLIQFDVFQQKINHIKAVVTYLCDEGELCGNREYGWEYTREPRYTTEIIRPDIDLVALFETLQDQLSREDTRRANEVEMEGPDLDR